VARTVPPANGGARRFETLPEIPAGIVDHLPPLPSRVARDKQEQGRTAPHESRGNFAVAKIALHLRASARRDGTYSSSRSGCNIRALGPMPRRTERCRCRDERPLGNRLRRRAAPER
jgi:hypothetical protein